MTFLSLFSNEYGLLATSQRVYSREEISSLHVVVDQAAALNERLSEQQAKQDQALSLAQESGFEQGLERGLAEAQMRVGQQLLQLRLQYEHDVQALRASCAELAVDIVRRIAGSVESSQWLAAQAEQAATELIDQPTLTLRVHADQVDAVTKRLDNTAGGRFSRVLADDYMSPAACVLETAAGQINIDMETQLGNILQLLTDEVPTDG